MRNRTHCTLRGGRRGAAIMVALAAALAATMSAKGAAIASITPSSVPVSGRIVISGSGFGAVQGSGEVLVLGVPAPVTSWSDTSITAYVLGSTPLGFGEVAVVGVDGLGDTAAVEILPLETGDGHIQWRFKVDAASIPHRQAVGPDGSVYVQDQLGRVYALSSSGLLEWIFDTGGLAEGPIAVADDGTIYASGNPAGPDVQILAINPDGSKRWSFSDPGVTQGIIAGPGIGPDGNIYAVTQAGGLGAFSLTPEGELRWSNEGDPVLLESGPLGLEIGFNADLGRLYVAFDEVGVGQVPRLYSFDMDSGAQEFAVPSAFLGTTFSDPPFPTIGPDGRVYMNTGNAMRAFDPESGGIVWTALPFSNAMLRPSIGGDGRIYAGRALFQLVALAPSGTLIWNIVDSGILFAPVVGPGDEVIVVGGRVNFGDAGFVKAFTTDGDELWQVGLPFENGAHVIASNRATFSADGQSAYIGTSIPGQVPVNPCSYLYALAVKEPTASPFDLSGDGAVDGADLALVLAAWGACDACGNCPADLNGDCIVDGADLAFILAAWGR